MTASTHAALLATLADHVGAEPVMLCQRLHAAGHDAVIVGGPVRDLLRGQHPKDVDLATSATPDQVRALFPRTFVQGAGERHGTIGVLGQAPGVTYEVTTFRRDVDTDGRHATVAFTTSLEEDLLRRDFTINAMAIRPAADGGPAVLVDPYSGWTDLQAGVLRAVGDPAERFREDYLRILRAYRFAARLGLTIEPATRAAIRDAVPGLAQVSRERVWMELVKMAGDTREPGRLATALRAMHEDGVLASILPEVAACDGVTQNRYHAFDVLTHLFAACDAAGPDDARRRLALLFHDIGKPATRTVDPAGHVHFYGHEDVGATLMADIARRLKLSTEDRDYLVELVAQHMRLHQVAAEPTAKAVRRLARDLHRGVTLEDLLAVRVADKRGSGVAASELDDATVARLTAVIAEVQAAASAVRTNQLAIDGHEVMAALDCGPGKHLGVILGRLLDRVIDEPALNTREALLALLPAVSADVSLMRRAPSR